MNITLKIGHNYFNNGTVFFNYKENHAKIKKR